MHQGHVGKAQAFMKKDAYDAYEGCLRRMPTIWRPVKNYDLRTRNQLNDHLSEKSGQGLGTERSYFQEGACMKRDETSRGIYNK